MEGEKNQEFFPENDGKKNLRAKSDRMYKKWLKKFSSFFESDG